MHVNKIEAKQNYFGVEKEKLDTLKHLRNSLKDSFKLYIATVISLCILTMIGIIEMTSAKFLYDFRFAVLVLFHITDIFAFIFTQSAVRDYLKRVFFPCCKSAVIVGDA